MNEVRHQTHTPRIAVVPNGADSGKPLLVDGTQARRIGGLPGPEDIVIDHERGIAYVSSQRRGPGSAGQVNGGIFRLNLLEDDPQPVNVTGNWEEKIGFFHPHGLDLFIGADGRRRLFVINHRNEDDHCIEVFDVDDHNRLSYVRRAADGEALSSPNDLVALSEDSFLVVNDHGFRSKLAKFAEDALRLGFNIGLGTVVQGHLTPTGVHWKTLINGIGFGAGIQVDNRSAPSRLYVSSASANKIHVYHHGHDGWTAAQPIGLDAGPDNLTWDRQGGLWVAAHPDPLAFVWYMAGWRQTAPSRVLRIADPDQPEPVAEEIFADDGTLLSAASVAALYSGTERSRLLLGAVAGRHLLIFDLPPLAANSNSVRRHS